MKVIYSGLFLTLLTCLYFIEPTVCSSNSFQIASQTAFAHTHQTKFILLKKLKRQSSLTINGSNNDQNDKETEKKGYKFGDFTKSFLSKVTKNEDYQFGDLTKLAKSKINELTENEEYEFGDLTRYIDSRVKEKVAKFANKDNYEFGDLTKEILRRVASSDFKWGDMVILLKALMSFGVGLNPIASFLPVTFLINLLNYSIAADVGDRFVSAVTLEIDKKMKKALTGDPEYQLGDLSKRAILKFIGKDDYDFGDITKTVLDSLDKQKDTVESKGKDGKQSEESFSFLGEMDEKAILELEAWDSKILEQANENKEDKKSEGKL